MLFLNRITFCSYILITEKKDIATKKSILKTNLINSKSKSIVDWPGLVEDISGADYKMIIYRADDEAKQILKEVDALSDWSGKNPEYLAFFNGQKCWFYSASLIGVAAIINPDNLDFEFIEKHGLSHRKNRYTIDGNSFLSGDLDNLF